MFPIIKIHEQISSLLAFFCDAQVGNKLFYCHMLWPEPTNHGVPFHIHLDPRRISRTSYLFISIFRPSPRDVARLHYFYTEIVPIQYRCWNRGGLSSLRFLSGRPGSHGCIFIGRMEEDLFVDWIECQGDHEDHCNANCGGMKKPNITVFTTFVDKSFIVL